MYIGCLPTWHMYYSMFIHVYIIYSIYYNFPIFYYKLYLNTVHKYIITIYLYMLPVFLYPKDGKKYIYYRSTIWGLLPYKNT